jgi:GntR family transcriptional regulator
MSAPATTRGVRTTRSPAALKHEQIAAVLEQEIRTGRVERGRQLPGETALAERFSVSRNTIRAALLELSHAGLIATRSGKGSFVTYDGRPIDARLGWAEALHRQGVETRAELLRLERVRDARLAATLGVVSSDFIAIDRMRRNSQTQGISLERSRLPVTLRTADLPERGLVDDSLTRTMIVAGLVGSYGEQTVGCRQLTLDEAATLGRPSHTWFLHTSRTTWSADDTLVEHVDSVLDPAHFELRLHVAED